MTAEVGVCKLFLQIRPFLKNKALNRSTDDEFHTKQSERKYRIIIDPGLVCKDILMCVKAGLKRHGLGDQS